MDKIRVLVVDDTVIVRRLVSDVLSSDPGIEVVGVAANGKIALDKVRQLRPDIVTLDVEMPVMDGIETLCHLRRDYPALPVIMFSTMTERGALKTIEALSRGATDYVTKPSQTGSLQASLERVREELLPKVKNLTRASAATPTTPAPAGPTGRSGGAPASDLPGRERSGAAAESPSGLRARAPRGSDKPLGEAAAVAPRIRLAAPTKGPIDVVAIAVSTGGPNALSEVLGGLPEDLSVPVLIVQHMPPMFTQMLAQRLNGMCPLAVAEGYEGAPVEPGQIYLAPGGRHMEVQRGGTHITVHLTDGPEENSCRPAADVLLRSVARQYGARALAVVLTGMGQDGMRGCEAIASSGGTIFAQDEASSVVWGMPGAVLTAGLACEMLALRDIAWSITRRVRGGDGVAAHSLGSQGDGAC